MVNNDTGCNYNTNDDRPGDKPAIEVASANATAAEAFLNRMPPVGEPTTSEDITKHKHQQKQRQKESVAVKSHAIDALSAVVKPALKRYYKSKAISSAADFKHLCVIVDMIESWPRLDRVW